MKRTTTLALWLTLILPAAAAPPDRAWIARSNEFTQQALTVELRHDPEEGSSQGLSQMDPLVSNPTLADEQLQRQELESVLAGFVSALATEQDPRVDQDLQILIDKFRLDFRQQDYALAHKVSYHNPSKAVFSGIRPLLDEQTAPERRPAALVRLRKYAGLEPGSRPLTAILKQRTLEQMAKKGVVFPARQEIETELSRNSNYLSGLQTLFEKYKLDGWQEPLSRLQAELTDYDAWVRSELLPRARPDFREPAEEYALDFEAYGIDIAPARIAEMAHRAFKEIQVEMAPLAAEIATRRHLPSNDYREVIKALKRDQISGDAILPLYQSRLAEIEKIITQHELVTLPDRPAVIRLASAAETARTPAPHMVPPPFLHNTGQRGVFVLPLNIPGGQKYDDFTFDAAAWTLTAHEARPGHELQFDSMVEQGVSLARALYAFNSTNAEGWGLYSEWMIKPYMPPEGQLVSLDYRLLRAARAFLDPELQLGKIKPAEATQVLLEDVVASKAFAAEEVERYTYHAPGQANSYFYGFTKLLELRNEAEKVMGLRFDQRKFHDFILSQGLLPPKLMRKAVLEGYCGQKF